MKHLLPCARSQTRLLYVKELELLLTSLRGKRYKDWSVGLRRAPVKLWCTLLGQVLLLVVSSLVPSIRLSISLSKTSVANP